MNYLAHLTRLEPFIQPDQSRTGLYLAKLSLHTPYEYLVRIEAGEIVDMRDLNLNPVDFRGQIVIYKPVIEQS